MSSVLNYTRLYNDLCRLHDAGKARQLLEEKIKTVKKELCIELVGRQNTETIVACAFLESGYVRVPFHFGKSKLGCIQRPQPSELAKPGVFSGKLRDEQLVIFERCKCFLDRDDVVLLVSFAGFGKTIVACALATHARLKTLIVVNRLCLIEQWKNSLLTFCSSVATVVKNDVDFENDTQFSIVNITKLNKASLKSLKKFHLVILDETHLLFSKVGHQNLLRLSPLKLVGLTATDWRYDGLHALFNLFYGNARVERRRTAAEQAQMTAVRVQTEFRPVVVGRGMGQWSQVLNQSASDEERNRMIVAIVRQHSNVVFIVLVKRVEQAKLLAELLSDQHVACLTGSQQSFDRTARIIIGTTQKLGTGFDFSRAGGLILAADVVQYIEQYIGRVMRRPDSQPLIFDFYDNYKTLQNHFEARDKAYGSARKKSYNPITNSYT
jgi:superfamily II DNA or RNA helicase